MKNFIRAVMLSDSKITEEEIIAKFCLKFGSSRRTVKEYLKVLKGAGEVVVKNNYVWTPDALEAEKILRASNQISNGQNNQGVKKDPPESIEETQKEITSII